MFWWWRNGWRNFTRIWGDKSLNTNTQSLFPRPIYYIILCIFVCYSSASFTRHYYIIVISFLFWTRWSWYWLVTLFVCRYINVIFVLARKTVLLWYLKYVHQNIVQLWHRIVFQLDYWDQTNGIAYFKFQLNCVDASYIRMPLGIYWYLIGKCLIAQRDDFILFYTL